MKMRVISLYQVAPGKAAVRNDFVVLASSKVAVKFAGVTATHSYKQ